MACPPLPDALMLPNSFNLTVAICTYNGESRLPFVLDALRGQTGVEGLCWEVIVIDNNSQDATPAIVQRYQQNWPSQVPLIYVQERRQGLAFARDRAIQTARGQWVGFLDDDNCPDPGWVAAAVAFGCDRPQLGAFGSRVLGDFEVPPPPNFERIQPFLAIIDRGEDPLPYLPDRKVLPPGAGLVVRREAWQAHVPETLVLAGRVGGSMLAGEDLEALLHLQRAQWQIWYNPAMVVHHRIPRSRLEADYLKKLFFGIGLSRYRTRMLSFPAWQRPGALVLYALNDGRKILRHLLRHRRQVQTDVVAACEMQLYWASLISPLFFWFRRPPSLS